MKRATPKTLAIAGATLLLLACLVLFLRWNARAAMPLGDVYTVAVAASADDADSNPFGGVNYRREYLNIPAWSRGFWRFALSVPAGSHIQSAYLRLRADARWSGTHTAHLKLLDEA
ncbi:MAG: hypothetical protein D6796_09490, partial [Caldilineae bacterium]